MRCSSEKGKTPSAPLRPPCRKRERRRPESRRKRRGLGNAREDEVVAPPRRFLARFVDPQNLYPAAVESLHPAGRGNEHIFAGGEIFVVPVEIEDYFGKHLEIVRARQRAVDLNQRGVLRKGVLRNKNRPHIRGRGVVMPVGIGVEPYVPRYMVASGISVEIYALKCEPQAPSSILSSAPVWMLPQLWVSRVR